ncbi:hypothetical protein DV735_g4731, partial [Chaetothyriales sp. CBS 134920]
MADGEEYLPLTAGDDAQSAHKQRPGLSVSYPDQSLARSQGRWQRNHSTVGEEEAGANYGLPPRLTSQASPSAGSPVTSFMHRMATLRSPMSKTRFPSVRRQHGGQYATLDDGADGTDGEHYTVDISSLTGRAYELRDMTAHSFASSSRQALDSESTEYVGSHPEAQKPSFQSFVDKQKSIGAGLNAVGVEITPTQAQLSSSTPEHEINRSKTVRDIGQNLARERNQIIRVDNAVDLSSLEGTLQLNTDRAGRSLTSKSLMDGGQAETQSYFFPDDPDVPNWKPFSLKTWYISLLMILAFALAAVQEVLYQISTRRHHAGGGGGLLAFNSVSDVATGPFFAWKYLPTMVAIVYAVLFSIMDFDVRRLEPFYQLSQPSGASASASLNLDHLTMFQYFIPFKALRLRQWAVFFSSVGNIIASMAAPALQNPVLQFGTNKHCQNHDADVQARTCKELNEYEYYVYVPSVWSRCVTAAYIVVGLVLIVLLVQMQRKSGLLSDPNGIAGIASMATKSHILRDFKGLDQADHLTIHRRLAHRRFVLYKSSLWQGEWRMEADELQDSEDKLKSPHPMMLRKTYGLPFVSFMLFGLVTIPLISLTPARIVPNTVPWLPVLLATLLKLLFTTFESDVRMMEPFYILSRGNAPPHHSLTLDYQATVYGWLPIKALANGHYIVALVGLASLMLDVLTVTVGSFSVDSRLDASQMQARLRALRKHYGLGWFRGRDGEIHCAIDEEPMKSRYVHGKPYTKAQARPAQADEPFYYAGYVG